MDYQGSQERGEEKVAIEKKKAKPLSESDLVAIMTLRIAESVLRRVVDATDAVSETTSETQAATPSSLADERDLSESPVQAHTKAGVS